MDPIRIGWLGSALDGPGGGYDRIHRMAFDERSIGVAGAYGSDNAITVGPLANELQVPLIS